MRDLFTRGLSACTLIFNLTYGFNGKRLKKGCFMVRPDVIQKRLAKIEEYLGILAKIQRCPVDQFLYDPEKYGSAERFLQLAIEALDDVGNQIIADMNLGAVDSASDIPQRLQEHGYIPADLAATWVRMIGFRNILVHDYLDVAHRRVYEVLHQNLDDIRAVMRAFVRFL